jgi:hypothetical protein
MRRVSGVALSSSQVDRAQIVPAESDPAVSSPFLPLMQQEGHM